MNKRRCILTIVLTIFLTGTATALTLTVDDNGGQDFLTIKEAVDSVNYGESAKIIVYPGIYNDEEIESRYKDLIIQSLSGNPDDTIMQSFGRTGTAFDFDGTDGFVTVTVSDITIRGYDRGIYSYGPTSTVSVENCRFVDNSYGLYFDSKINIDVANNGFIDNAVGFRIWRSTVHGLREEIRDNLFSGNSIGFDNDDSSYYVFYQNTLVDNDIAMRLLSNAGTIKNNTIYNNGLGILCSSHDCEIYNNYLNNTNNAEVVLGGNPLVFNTTMKSGINIVGGPSIGGNYWGKPDGTGWSQTHEDIDGDGFCDEPYIIDQFIATDHLPLVKVQSPSNSEIPEFPTIALPVAAIVGLALFFQRRKE